MKRILFAFLTAAFLATSLEQSAQVSTYSFTQSSGSYGASGSGTFIGLPFQDDDFTLVNLPFPFRFNGVTHNTVNVCSNGFLSFNTVTGNEFFPLSDNTTTNVISGFGQDIVMGIAVMGDLTSGSTTITNLSSVIGFSVGDVLFDYNLDFGSNPTITAISGNSMVVNVAANNTSVGYAAVSAMSAIWQQVSGTAPNRVVDFEFYRFCRFVPDEVINFKIRLHETSSKIEVVFGTMVSGLASDASEIGLKGNNTSDFNSRRVVGNAWSASQAATQITHDCEFSTTSIPPSGLTYAWAPETCTVPALAIAPSNTFLCTGMSATLTASGASNYTWSTGSGSAQLVVSPGTNTVYTVSAGTSTCVTSKTVALVVSTCADLKNTLPAGSLEVAAYPNPFGNLLTIETTGDAGGNVTITDALGKIVHSSDLGPNSPASINTSSLNRGLYFVSFRSGSGTVTKKLIKE